MNNKTVMLGLGAALLALVALASVRTFQNGGLDSVSESHSCEAAKANLLHFLEARPRSCQSNADCMSYRFFCEKVIAMSKDNLFESESRQQGVELEQEVSSACGIDLDNEAQRPCELESGVVCENNVCASASHDDSHDSDND